MFPEKTGKEDRELHLQVRACLAPEYERNTRGDRWKSDDKLGWVFLEKKGGWRVEDRWPYSQPEGIRWLPSEEGF